MKRPSSEQISRFILFALPSYWILAVMFVALAIWNVGFDEPDFIPLAWVSIAILVAAIFLVKNCYWICVPMVLLGIYIFFALNDDQHVGHIVPLYGAYLVLHYLACLIHAVRIRKMSGGRQDGGAEQEEGIFVAILCITLIAACAVLFVG